MKIIIVGDGKVGAALAQQLSADNHDIVMIDSNIEALEASQEALDVITVEGNGADYDVLEEAGVRTADLLIAVTSMDETNLLCCVLAKKMGCRKTIARVRNKVYEKQVSFLKQDLGLTMTVNPEKAAAREIFGLLQLPSFLKRESFAHGRIELVELKVGDGGPLDGCPLSKLESVARVKTLVCAVERGDTVTIPRGDFVLRAGDKVSVTAATGDLVTLIDNLSIRKKRVQRVMIIGGSRIAALLAEELIASHIDVKIIELDPARCTALSAELPRAMVLQGDGSRQDLLIAEDIHYADAVVTLTGMDEENIVVSMLAEALGVEKTITKINRSEYEAIFKSHGIDSVINPKIHTVHRIACFVREMENSEGDAMVSLCSIVNHHAEAMEFLVTDRTLHLGVPFHSLHFQNNVLVAAIFREGKIIIPGGQDMLRPNDTVVLVAHHMVTIRELNDIFVEK